MPNRRFNMCRIRRRLVKASSNNMTAFRQYPLSNWYELEKKIQISKLWGKHSIAAEKNILTLQFSRMKITTMLINWNQTWSGVWSKSKKMWKVAKSLTRLLSEQSLIMMKRRDDEKNYESENWWKPSWSYLFSWTTMIFVNVMCNDVDL